MGPGLRIAVPLQGCHHLVDQAGLTVGGGLHGPQMPRFDPEPAQLGDERGDSHRLRVVRRRPGSGATSPYDSHSVEFLVADPGGREQLARGRSGRRWAPSGSRTGSPSR